MEWRILADWSLNKQFQEHPSIKRRLNNLAWNTIDQLTGELNGKKKKKINMNS